MATTRVRELAAVTVLALALPAGGAIGSSRDVARPPAPAVTDPAARAVPVPAWDPASPQRLVRIDGALFQREGDRDYPVIEDRISARLSDAVESWEDLLERAVAAAPGTFSVLERLRPLRVNRLGILDLAIPERTDPADWAELVHRTGLVRYAEVATRGEYLATQSDPRYPEQWNLHNTGQTGGSPGADIDLQRAWDLVVGDPAVVVAILDSGTEIDHEDLAANVWHNDDEIPGNGVDDDGNGFVDDWEGWDFDHGDNDPRSSNYHGTHVTGVVNAVGSNGVGIAGVAGGLAGGGVRGMALNVGNSGPNSAAVDDALLYAADNGADVITMSLSIGASQAIDDALDYAYNTRDVFIDCASGNNGSSVAYPATRPEVMAVGATDHDDLSSWFSNPGPEVEVAAPGSDILSTRLGNSYGTDDGTSFAAPHVAGVAALVLSRNPNLPAPDVRQLLIDTAEDVDDPGFDTRTGYGRINAYEAVLLAATSDGVVRLDAEAYGCLSAIEITVSDIDLAGAGSLTVTVRSDTETAGESVSLVETGAGAGVFEGTIAADEGPALPDGTLQVTAGDTVTAEYLDADDGHGGTDILKSDTAIVDCLAPAIFDVGTENPTDTAVDVVWSTDEPATSLVRYGTQPPPTLEASRAALTDLHDVKLGGLEECTRYLYEVQSADGQGNTAIDDNAGAFYAFETYGYYPETGPVPCHQGQVLLDRTEPYGCDDTVGVTVIDVDLDLDPGSVESVDVLLTSSSETDGEWITLTESSSSNSRFQGSVSLTPGGANPGDGVLAVSAGDLITATYRDEDDGIRGPYTATAYSTADCTAPSMQNVHVTDITAVRAVVRWTTDEPATSRVEFGPTAALGSVAESLEAVTSHAVPISPFDACQKIHFRVSSTDANGNVRVADAAGAPFAFDLWQIGGLIWFDEFETDTGWTLTGEWERGAPQGLGSSNADPAEAWSGSFLIGNDLSGQGTYAGDYEPSASESARSPVFGTRQERDVELLIRRKLGVVGGDTASIHVVTGGTDQVWSGGSFYDLDWYQHRIDISAVAGNKSSVQIEFRLVSANASHSYGWNIDEVIVKDSTQPDYLTCGGCAGAPAFAGVASVHDPDPCGPGGLVVQWERAPAWGTGAGGTYEVYRGTVPGFTPSASNRVASGLTGTSWTDSAAPVDTPVWYVVRARNDESCSADGGLDDGNTIRAGATETTSVPLPAPVGNTLVTSLVGGAHVRLEWTAAPGADRYVVRRASAPDFSDAVEVGSTSSAWFEDAGGASEPGFHGYRVLAVDACGREE